MQFDQLGRREFITLLGGVAAGWPLAARAQETGQIRHIGFLGPARDNIFAMNYPPFLAELRKLGFTEGKNLIIETPTGRRRSIQGLRRRC
jgi:putative ABC transport system substrate-binding protein